ncbi:MAG: diguanylate cyclase [Aquitalea sp.]|nr:diguanylate cyclase [Aquitalea sp.]
MHKSLSRLPGGPQARLLAFIVLANLFVLAILLTLTYADYQQIQQQAEARSHTLNSLLSASVSAEIDRIDMGLATCVAEMERVQQHPDSHHASVGSFMALVKQRLPMVANLILTDSVGTIIESTVSNTGQTVKLADRDYFIALRSRPDAGLVISRPFMGRIINQPVIVFARRINRRDGSFVGMVAATVRIKWFQQRFSQIDVGPDGTLVWRGDASRNFDLLARYRPVQIGQTTVSNTFRATIAAHPLQGTYQAVAGADGITRTFSYQKLHDYPLITLVGLARSDYLVDWQRHAALFLAIEVGFLLISSLGGLIVLKAWRSHARASAQTQLLMTSAASGIFGVDRVGICTFLNPAASQMLGLKHGDELLGSAIHTIIHHHQADGRSCHGEQCLLFGALSQREVHVARDVFWRVDGKSFPVEFWVRPQYDQHMLQGFVVTFVDISERLMAHTDSLTGLANRRHFDEALPVEWSHHLRAKDAFSLLLLDVDHFKRFNDTYGHVAGDDCLRRVAVAIQAAMSRLNYTATRYGGEEFACILPDTGQAEAIAVAERIMAGVKQLAIPHDSSGVESEVTISIGIITATPDCIGGALEMVNLADRQLYLAKTEGRNRLRSAMMTGPRPA